MGMKKQAMLPLLAAMMGGEYVVNREAEPATSINLRKINWG